MATPRNLDSAKIIEFPLQRRLGSAGRDGLSAPDKASSLEMYEVVSDGWYHDAAIRDEQPRKQ